MKNNLPQNPEESSSNQLVSGGHFPSWLHRPLPNGNSICKTHKILSKNLLPTVCEEARCPNCMECFSKKRATFLVLGKQCTRSCGFCSIEFAKTPAPVDPTEPERIVNSIKSLQLNHVVITMVTRDDLSDGGAAHLSDIILLIRKRIPHTTIEVLTSDFAGNEPALNTVLDAKPNIFNHNIETVRALTSSLRHKASYDLSLHMLRLARSHSSNCYIKSGLMVGLGESDDQVFETLSDLRGVGCDIVTIGHYLQSDKNKFRVKNFVNLDQFKKYADYGHRIGITKVYSAPFVRSSYNAADLLGEMTSPPYAEKRG